jgi:hypothetical protein
MPYVVEDFSNFLSKMALKSALLVSTPVTIDTGLPYRRVRKYLLPKSDVQFDNYFKFKKLL